LDSETINDDMCPNCLKLRKNILKDFNNLTKTSSDNYVKQMLVIKYKLPIRSISHLIGAQKKRNERILNLKRKKNQKKIDRPSLGDAKTKEMALKESQKLHELQLKQNRKEELESDLKFNDDIPNKKEELEIKSPFSISKFTLYIIDYEQVVMGYKKMQQYQQLRGSHKDASKKKMNSIFQHKQRLEYHLWFSGAHLQKNMPEDDVFNKKYIEYAYQQNSSRITYNNSKKTYKSVDPTITGIGSRYIIQYADWIESVILVSGDNDLHSISDLCLELNIHVERFAFNKQSALKHENGEEIRYPIHYLEN